MTTENDTAAAAEADLAATETVTTEPAKEAAADASATPEGETLLTGDPEGNEEDGKDKSSEEEPDDDAKKSDVPEDYEFTFAEGIEIDSEVLGNLKEVAKELGLSQEQAQKVADLGAKQAERWAQAQQDAMQAAEAEWIDTIKADKEIGGDKLNETVAVAVRAIDRFGSPEFKTFLKESRLGNHPEMIRFAYQAGKAIADDSVVPGGRQVDAGRKPFYDNSNHKS